MSRKDNFSSIFCQQEEQEVEFNVETHYQNDAGEGEEQTEAVPEQQDIWFFDLEESDDGEIEEQIEAAPEPRESREVMVARMNFDMSLPGAHSYRMSPTTHLAPFFSEGMLKKNH